MKRVALAGVVAALALTAPLSAALRGAVMTAGGAPVAGARVVALEAPASSPFEQTVQDGASPLAVATTDTEGSYILDLHGYGLVTVRVTADGYAPAAVTAALDEPADRIVLRPAPVIEGKVTAQGKPVEGAEVTAIGEKRSAMSVTTDANGRYRMPDPRLWAVMIGVRHRDYAPAWTSADNRDFTLEPGKTVEGRVIDAKERPVAGARVELSPWNVTATTAADGSFRFQHVTVEASSLRVSAPGGIAMRELVNGRQTLKLAPAGRISGVIRDAEKHPLSGIRVVTQSQTINGDEAVSGRDGTFQLTVPRGAYGLADAGNGIYDIAGEANAKEGDVRVELVATRRTTIEGVVRDAAGKAVPGATVTDLIARPVEMIAASVLEATVSGAGGRFRLRRQGGDSQIQLVAVRSGMPIGYATVSAAHARNVVITLTAGVPVDGRVVDSGQHPVKGVAIRPRIAMPMAGEGPLELPETWATTGADGRFHGLMGEGSVTLTFVKEGYSSAERVVDVRASMKAIDVTLVPATHVAGRVVQKDGTPAAGVKVTIDTSSVTTGGDGSFRIENVLTGEHAITFGDDFPRRQSVRAPADDVKLVLPALRTVRGRVVDAANGAPVGTFSLSGNDPAPYSQEEGLHAKAFESTAGEFTFELPETESSLVAMAEGYLPAEIRLTASTDPLVLRLSHGRSVRGRVTDEGGQPLGGVRVTDSDHSFHFGGEVEEDSEDGKGLVHSAADGSFEMSGLVVDHDAQLEFRKSGFVRLMLKVRPDSDAALEVVLRRGVSIHGRVVDAGGGGVTGAVVSASSAAHGAESGTALTDDGGEFHFDRLLPARWDFVARHQESGRRGAAKDVDIEKVHELTILMDSAATATISGHVGGLEPSWSMRYVEARGADEATGRAEIDAAGNYRMEHAPAGTVAVSAIAGPTVDMAGLAKHTKSVSVDVAPGSEVRADLAFLPQVTVHGRVTRGGAPLEGATIQFSYEQHATTAAGGSYSLQLMPDEYDVAIIVSDRQLPFAQHVVINDAAELNFSVDVATIGVTVIDNTGQPLAGAKVTAAPHGQTHTTATATTGADGTATLEVAAGETETIGASLRGCANASQDVAAGGSSSVTLQLVRSPGAAVRIVDVRDGRTLSGYAIARDASGRVLASANEAEPDGTLILALAPGTYRFSASAENYGSHTIQAEVPSGEIRLPLPRGGKLALRSNSNLHASARLLQPNGEEYVRCWCSGVAEIAISGAVTLVDQIAPGSYTLEVTPAGGKPRTYPVTVTEGVTTTVSLDSR
jgi:protocatechuate 3,4-dioxygenase beta subunit